MNYFVAWIKSFEIVFSVRLFMFNIGILIFSFFAGIEDGKFVYSISVRFPKYALVLTSGDRFYYQNQCYRFYRKVFFKHIKFYVLHVVGANATEIKGKESKWDIE